MSDLDDFMFFSGGFDGGGSSGGSNGNGNGDGKIGCVIILLLAFYLIFCKLW